jgi:hypothetical protein
MNPLFRNAGMQQSQPNLVSIPPFVKRLFLPGAFADEP